MPGILPPPLARWLRRANAHPQRRDLLLSGSALIAALCPSARPPNDLDYVVRAAYDPGQMRQTIYEIAALPDRDGPLRVNGDPYESTYYDDAFPCMRAALLAEAPGREPQGFLVDFTYGDPLTLPPRTVVIEDVGPVLAVRPETLFAWKVHALVQFGLFEWRPKDLYDLRILWTEGRLERGALAGAIDVAFSSRATTLDELDAVRFSSDWGVICGGAERWAEFAAAYKVALPFATVRAEVRAALDSVL